MHQPEIWTFFNTPNLFVSGDAYSQHTASLPSYHPMISNRDILQLVLIETKESFMSARQNHRARHQAYNKQQQNQLLRNLHQTSKHQRLVNTADLAAYALIFTLQQK